MCLHTGATARPATTVAVHPEGYNRHRGGDRTRTTPAPPSPEPHEAAGAAAQQADPGPNPAGRGAEPNVYITHPTHGAGTRSCKTQPPTATRKTTLNAGRCVRQPREGRGRNRQTPPKKEKNSGGGGGERTAHSHQTAHQHRRGGQTPHPEGTEDGTPETGTGGPPSQNRQHQARSSDPPGRGTPKTRRHTPRLDEKKKRQQPSPKERGWGGSDHKARHRDSQRPTPQSESKSRPPQKKTHPDNRTKWAGHSRDPSPARTPTQHTPARKGGAQAGRGHKHTRTPTPEPGVAGRSTNHTRPHSTPNQEVRETTRDGHMSTHEPQKPPKERRGAAETQTPARTPTPHTGTGNGGVQAERARNHARPIPPTTKGGVQAGTQAQPQTPHTPAGKRGTTPQTVPTHTRPRPSQDWPGYRNPHPTTTRTQTQAPHHSRKPPV